MGRTVLPVRRTRQSSKRYSKLKLRGLLNNEIPGASLISTAVVTTVPKRTTRSSAARDHQEPSTSSLFVKLPKDQNDQQQITTNQNVNLYQVYSPYRFTRSQKLKVGKLLSEHQIETTRISEKHVNSENEHATNTDIQLLSNSHTHTKMKRKHESAIVENSSGGGKSLPEKKACKKSSSFTAVENSVCTIDKRTPSATSSCGGSIWSPPDPNSPPSLSVGLNNWLQQFLSWSAQEKVHSLENLISVCQPHEVKYVQEVIAPHFHRDFISLLPKELALYVLSFLEPRDLLVAAQTCKYWRVLAEDNLMWKEKCLEEGILEPHLSKAMKGSWKNRRSGIGSVVGGWKAAYLRHVRIEMNWLDGKDRISKILKGHDDHVITCLQFNGSRIVSGSDDNTLKVWSAVSGKCLRTLTGHTGGVWASQMRRNLIISGSTDRTLKIWNMDTGNCVHTLHGHTSTVRCLALHDNVVVSGSRDATLRAWNIDTGEFLYVYVGHMAAVRCVCYNGEKVVSGAYDYMVKVWNPTTQECLHTLQGHTNRVYSLQFDGKYVVSGSLDTSIRVWDVHTGQCLHTLMGHQSLTSGMELKDNILVSGNADSTVKVWDILTGECLKTLEGSNKHVSAVTCLQFYGKFVITSSDDGTVKLWDIRSGKVVRDLVTLESRGSGGVVWRIRASETKLVCAVGSRNGTEETKLLVLDFDPDSK